MKRQCLISVVVCLLVVTAGCGGSNTTDGSEGRISTDSEFSEQFSISVDRNSISECGVQCRDVNVSATFENVGNESVENVTVEVNLFIGLIHTEVFGKEIDIQMGIWEGQRTIGTLKPGEDYETTASFRVKNGLNVKLLNDCDLDFEVNAESTNENWTYRGKKKVC